jgi:16S rRNA G1207 methylase RsmC
MQELIDLIEQLESGQAIYIAHKNDKIDRTLANFINRYPERKKMKIMFLRESEGVYQFG